MGTRLLKLKCGKVEFALHYLNAWNRLVVNLCTGVWLLAGERLGKRKESKNERENMVSGNQQQHKSRYFADIFR